MWFAEKNLQMQVCNLGSMNHSQKMGEHVTRSSSHIWYVYTGQSCCKSTYWSVFGNITSSSLLHKYVLGSQMGCTWCIHSWLSFSSGHISSYLSYISTNIWVRHIGFTSCHYRGLKVSIAVFSLPFLERLETSLILEMLRFAIVFFPI